MGGRLSIMFLFPVVGWDFDKYFLQIGLDTGYWTAINHFFIWGSLAVYFAILFAMHSNGLFDMFPNQFRFVGEYPWHPLNQ